MVEVKECCVVIMKCDHVKIGEKFSENWGKVQQEMVLLPAFQRVAVQHNMSLTLTHRQINTAMTTTLSAQI